MAQLQSSRHSTTERIDARARDLAEGGAKVFAGVADLSDHEQAHTFVQQVFNRFGRIDILRLPAPS